MNPCTFGVEEEFIVVDTDNLMPAPYDFDQCARDAGFKKEFLSREMHHAVIETKTPICHDLQQLAVKIGAQRDLAVGCLGMQNLKLLASASHPFADWRDVPMIEADVYQEVVREYQQTARANFTFGTHVHIGFKDDELAVQVANVIREYIPLLLALSSNSPYWQGQLTGLKSYRNRTFKQLPRTGIPPVFKNLAAYQEFIDWLTATGSIKKPTSIWTDVRVHPVYRTLELRVMDQQTSLKDAIGLCLFSAGLAVHIGERLEAGENIPLVASEKIEENLWRASRWGMDAEFIDFETQQAISCRDQAYRLLESMQPTLRAYAGNQYNDCIEYLIRSSGADHQLFAGRGKQCDPYLLEKLVVNSKFVSCNRMAS